MTRKYFEQRTHWGGTPRVSGAKRGMRGFSNQVAERHPQDLIGTEWRRAPATRAAWLRRRSVNAARRKTFSVEGKVRGEVLRLITEERSELMCRLERQAKRRVTQRSWSHSSKIIFDVTMNRTRSDTAKNFMTLWRHIELATRFDLSLWHRSWIDLIKNFFWSHWVEASAS